MVSALGRVRVMVQCQGSCIWYNVQVDQGLVIYGYMGSGYRLWFGDRANTDPVWLKVGRWCTNHHPYGLGQHMIMAIEGIKKSSLRSSQQVEANTMRKCQFIAPNNMRKRVSVSHVSKESSSKSKSQKGHPIGTNSCQFTHFLGHLSGSYQYCPIYRPWNKVKPEKKDKLLKFLRTKFDIPLTANSWILQSYGRKTKNWRARVKECFFDPSKPMEELLKSPPLQLTKRHWRRLLEYWTRDNVMEMIEKNKANRTKKKFSQMTGKKSFVRIHEELKCRCSWEESQLGLICLRNVTKAVKEQMKDLTEKLGDGATDAPGPDDVFATVMGKAKNGTAEMYGLGVRANHLWCAGPSRLSVSKANAQLMSRNAKLEEENARLKAEKNNGPGALNDGSRVHANGSGDHHLWVDKEVYVKNLTNFENVAIGRLRIIDPNTVLNGTELRHGWCEVHVQAAIKKDEALFRPYDYLKCIHDVTGTSIAWPVKLIELVRED
ncbi:uncharacterized protein [Rutidosis leptorrhynchoides]|uniref:uncharacterized protein n=1 Tax=Rutidosis leptorrhynchoides TaxID=125765 RepID=UPI003A994F24